MRDEDASSPAPADTDPHAARLALLWGVPKAGRRGPKPTLSVAAIVACAIALADAHGLAALSMERIAQELGVTTMALYRYVPGKSELVALMLEQGLGPPPAVRARAWRAGLLRWAAAMFEVFRAHPWSLEATGRLRLMGPRELAWLEAGLALLGPTSLTPRERYGACLALIAEVRSAAQFAAPSEAGGLSGERWAAAMRGVIGAADGPFPHLHAVLTQRATRSALADRLAWVLDGIAARIERRRG